MNDLISVCSAEKILLVNYEFFIVFFMTIQNIIALVHHFVQKFIIYVNCHEIPLVILVVK